MKNERLETLSDEKLGEAWLQAIATGALERLTQLWSPRVTGRLLLPAGLETVNTATDLLARYQDWFGGYSAIRVEASRVARIGSKLGIFYRLLLQEGRTSERIEQQVFCIVKGGQVQQVHLVCSGFHAVNPNDPAPMVQKELPAGG
jgi:hypothetical protein